MKNIIILAVVALCSCEVAHYDNNKFYVNAIKSKDKYMCTYVINLPTNDKFTFIDSCSKFNPGDFLVLSK